MLDKGFLNWVKLPIAFQSLNCDDVLAIMHYRQCHARQNAAALDVDGACTTFASIA